MWMGCELQVMSTFLHFVGIVQSNLFFSECILLYLSGIKFIVKVCNYEGTHSFNEIMNMIKYFCAYFLVQYSFYIV